MPRPRSRPAIMEDGLLRVYPDGKVERRVGTDWVTCKPFLSGGRPMIHWKGHDGNKRQKWVHRLVAEAFVPNPNGYKTIEFKDGDMQNPAADNLDWTTRPGREKIYQSQAENVKAYRERRGVEHVQIDVRRDAPLNKAILQKAADALDMPLAQFLLKAAAKLILDNLGEEWLERAQKEQKKK